MPSIWPRAALPRHPAPPLRRRRLVAHALQQQQRRLLVALVLRARRVCAVRHLQPLGQRGELDLQRGGGGVRLSASPSRSRRAVPLELAPGGGARLVGGMHLARQLVELKDARRLHLQGAPRRASRQPPERSWAARGRERRHLNKRSQIRIRVGSENRPCSGRGMNSSLGEEGWSTLV